MNPYWPSHHYGPPGHHMPPGYPHSTAYPPNSYNYYSQGGMYYPQNNMGYYQSPVASHPYAGSNVSTIGFNVNVVDAPNILHPPAQPPPVVGPYRTEVSRLSLILVINITIIFLKLST